MVRARVRNGTTFRPVWFLRAVPVASARRECVPCGQVRQLYVRQLHVRSNRASDSIASGIRSSWGHCALELQRLEQFTSGQSGGTEAVTVDMEAMVAPCMVDMEAPCMVAWGQCMGPALSTSTMRMGEPVRALF